MGRWWRWLALPAAGLAWLAWLLAAGGSGSQSPQVARQEFVLGTENSWFQVQNVGSDSANLVVDYYGPAGNLVAEETPPVLAPGAAASFYQAINSDLPSGFGGSAVVTADGPIRTLLFKDITRNDRKSLGGDNTPSRGFHRQYLPLIYSGFGEDNAWHTRFVVQNSGNVTACVRLVYRGSGGEVVLTEPATGTLPNPSCPNGGLPLPPQGSLRRNQAEMAPALPQPFLGTLLVETVASVVPAAQQLIVAAADIWNADRSSFAAYKGFGRNLDGTGELATTVLLPIIQKDQGPQGGWSTSYQVTTADPAVPTSVTATYCCDPRLPGPGGTLETNFVVQGSALVDQAQEGGLPVDFNGAATLTADQPLAVVVLRRWMDSSVDSFSGYTGIPVSAAGPTVWIPLVYRQFSANWQSWFQVQVVNGGAAGVAVTYYGDSLPGGSATFTRTVTGVATFEQGQDPLLPAGFKGSAVIQASVPIAVAVVVDTDYYSGDATASFAAFGKEPPATTPTPTPTATPTPTPTATPNSTPPAGVQLFAGWNFVRWQPSGCKGPADAFRNLIEADVLNVVWLFVPQTQSWLGFDPGVPAGVNDLTQVCGGLIFSLNVASDSIWIQDP